MRKTNSSTHDNTSSPNSAPSLLAVQNRKRVLPVELDDRTVQPAARVVRQNVEIVTKPSQPPPPPIVNRPPPAKLPIPPTPPKLLNASSMLSSSPNRTPSKIPAQKPDEPVNTSTIDMQKDSVEFFIDSLEKDEPQNLDGQPEGIIFCRHYSDRYRLSLDNAFLSFFCLLFPFFSFSILFGKKTRQRFQQKSFIDLTLYKP